MADLPDGMTFAQVMDALALSEAAYGRRENAHGWKLEPLHPPIHRVQVFGAEKPGHMPVVTFRGTVSFSNWLTDARILLRPVEGLPGLWHRGFRRALEPCLPQIRTFVGSRAVMLTGHSLGGALATHMAARLSDPLVGTIVTFGAPRSCSRKAAIWLERQHGRKAVRVVSRGDLVPALPFPIGLRRGIYWHAFQSLEVGRGFDVEPDHYLEVYREGLETLMAP